MTSNSKNNLGDPQPSFGDCLFCFTSKLFWIPNRDMIECTQLKEWYLDCCKNIPTKYFKIDSIDYFCTKLCKSNADLCHVLIHLFPVKFPMVRL